MLTSVEVTGFRGLEPITLDLAGPTMLTGWNGSGKTTLLNAIRFALFGRCGWTDRRGAGAKALIAAGADEARIVVNMMTRATNAVTVLATIGPRENSFALTDSVTGELLAETRETMWHVLGQDPKAAEVACFPEEFCESESLGQALVELLGAEMNYGEFVEYIRKSLSPNESARILEGLGGAPETDVGALIVSLYGSDGMSRPEHWARVGKAAYDKRTIRNRDVKEFAGRIDDLGPCRKPKKTAGADIEPHEMSALKDSVEALEREREAILEEKGARVALDGVQGEPVDVDALLDDLIAKKAAHEAADAERGRLLKEETGIRSESQELVTREAALKVALAGEERDREETWAKVRELETDTCPTCGQKWGGDKKMESERPLRIRIGNLDESIKVKKDQAIGTEARLSQLGVSLSYAGSATDMKVEELAALESEMSDIEKALAGAQKVDAKGPQPRPAEEIEGILETLKERIDEGVVKCEQLSDYIVRAALVERRAEAEREVKLLSWCVENIHKGRFQRWCIEGPVADFVKRCSAELEAFGHPMGYELSEKRIDITIYSKRAGGQVPVREASNGEMALARYAIAKAFARSGGIAIIDNCDALDGRNKPLLLAGLKAMSDDGVTVICAGAQPQRTAPDLEKAKADLAPLSPVWMEDGEVKTATEGEVKA